jgi:hypothetical protein
MPEVPHSGSMPGVGLEMPACGFRSIEGLYLFNEADINPSG